MPMRRTHAAILALAALICATGTHAQSPYGIGRAATPAEIAGWNIDIGRDGSGLPAGSGTPAAGAKIYAAKCVACHGKNGEGIRQGTLQLGPKLIGRNPGDAFDFNQSTQKEGSKTIGNYWPYATTLYDYIRRAMPLTAPGTLTPDQTYAVTAFLLNKEGIVPDGTSLDAKSLAAIKMPARDHFVEDDRRGNTGGKNVR